MRAFFCPHNQLIFLYSFAVSRFRIGERRCRCRLLLSYCLWRWHWSSRSIVPGTSSSVEWRCVPGIATCKAVSVVFPLLVQYRVRVIERDIHFVRVCFVNVERNEVREEPPEDGCRGDFALDGRPAYDVSILDDFKFQSVRGSALGNLAILAVIAEQDAISVNLVTLTVRSLDFRLAQVTTAKRKRQHWYYE